MKIINKIEESRNTLTELAKQRVYPATPETHQILKTAQRKANELEDALREIDDDGNYVHTASDPDMVRLTGEIESNLNKYAKEFRKDTYDKCLNDPEPIKALLNIAVMDRVSYGIGKDKEGEPTVTVKVTPIWVDLNDFASYADEKEKKVYAEDPKPALTVLYSEVMTTTLQRFYIDYCDADNAKGRAAALKAANDVLGLSTWKAIKTFEDQRSRKVVKAKMAKALTALYNDEYKVNNSDYAFLMNAGLIYANSNTALGLSCIKPVTLRNLCTRMLIAKVHDLDLELLK